MREWQVLNYMRIEFKDFYNPEKPVTSVVHGKLGWSNTSTLDLDAGQYITKVSLGVVKVDTRPTWKTRIGFVKFETSTGDVLGCGGHEPGKTMVQWEAEGDSAFLLFSGADGDAIDNLAGHFMPRVNY